MSILSIITINYNDKVGLERTVNSVQEQTVQDFEYIIIDGGSNDGSKDFLNRSKDYFDYFISEPDTGVYEAMNKGIKQANSEYLLFLNSGDTLYDKNILSKVLPNLKSYQSQIVYGDLYMICEDKTNFINSYPKKLNFNFFKKSSLGHPSTFIKKELFEIYGYYRTDLKIVSDWEFFINTICVNHVSYLKINLIISNFYKGGISNNSESVLSHREERKQVLIEYFDYYDMSMMILF